MLLRAKAAKPDVAPDCVAIAVLYGSTSHQPPQQAKWVDLRSAAFGTIGFHVSDGKHERQ